MIIFFMSVGIFSTASETFPLKHLSVYFDYGKRLAVIGYQYFINRYQYIITLNAFVITF